MSEGDVPLPADVRAVRDAIEEVPGTHDVHVAGSGAAGDRTALSDWDFELSVNDDSVLAAMEAAMRALPNLAVFWDPLSARANLIVLLDGPTKIDLIVPDRASPVSIAAWVATAESLPHLDAHFWDWTLWLGAKHLRGRTELVDDELAKMHRALLAPLGITTPPRTVDDAVRSYLRARDERAAALGAVVDPRLGNQVITALTTHGVLTAPNP